jgi:Ni/Co efflux regulator RcnB
MRLSRVLLATAVAGVFATPVFAQATPTKAAKAAAMKDEKTESKAVKKEEKAAAKAAKSETSPELKAIDKATSAPKKWLKGVKLTATEKTQVTTIEKKYQDQLSTMKKDRQAAEKAGAVADPSYAAKVQAVADQEKAEIRAALTAPQQTKFDANVAAKAKK